ncbi:MAG: beta-N-acetylhexosaminidase family protein, partial [Planctomycetota bacterium]
MKTVAHLVLVLSCLVAIDTARSEVSVGIDPSSTSQVKLGSQRLERYLRQQNSDRGGRIFVARLDPYDPSIGDQGYRLASRESTLYVLANSEAG